MSYAEDQADAKALLTEDGQAVTLQAPTTGTYNPATASVGGSAPAAVSTVGVPLPLSRGLMNMPGSVVQMGDKRLLLPGDIAEPTIGTTATFGGNTYTIVQVNQLNPGGTALLHDCVIRAAA